MNVWLLAVLGVVAAVVAGWVVVAVGVYVILARVASADEDPTVMLGDHPARPFSGPYPDERSES